MDDLQREWPGDAQQAALSAARWRLDPSRESDRQAAADLFRKLYAVTPFIEYRRNYEELTGLRLPEPPPLPNLPDLVQDQPVDWPSLLDQVNQLIAKLRASGR